MSLQVVALHAVELVYPRVAGLLDKAIKHKNASSHTLNTVFAGLKHGDYMLAVDSLFDPHNAMVFRIESYNGIPTCYIMFAGGAGGEGLWEKHWDELVEYCSLLGVKRYITHAREALLRIFDTETISHFVELKGLKNGNSSV